MSAVPSGRPPDRPERGARPRLLLSVLSAMQEPHGWPGASSGFSPPLPSCRPEGQELTTVPPHCPRASCWRLPSHMARTGLTPTPVPGV